jgi:hypothetical protein
MSGKTTIIAFVALAASSASAATALVVYTRFFEPQPVHASAAGGGASGQGQAESAVVLNASEGFSFADSDGDSGSPACPSDGDSQRCALVLSGSDVRLRILGSTPTFPPIWLGGDSEDRYTLNSFFRPAFDTSSLFGTVVQNATNQPTGQTGPSDQNVFQTDGVQASRNSSNFALEIIAPSPSLDGGFPIIPIDQLGSNPLSAIEPIDALPVAEPLIGYSPSAMTGGGGTVPEPSTWVMMLVGFVSLGFAGYQASRKRVALAA